MSVSKYAYDPAMCDGDICVGDCDLCDKPKIAQIHNTATTQVQIDYIKRENDEWCTDCKEYDKERHCCPRWNKVIRDTVDEIRKNADVRENIKAMYIFDTHYGEWRCSNCGIVFEDYADEPPYNFCPNCGADMKGEA